MKISVIVPTNRIGGLDVLFSGLAGQTHQDFELVLIDTLYDARSEIVREMAKEMGISCTHVPPMESAPALCRKSGTYQKSLNTGVVNARGDVLLILCDYTWLSPDCLQRHAAAHPAGSRDVHIGEISYVRLPKLDPDLPLLYGWYAMGYDPADPVAGSYGPWLDDGRRHALLVQWRDAYVRDVESGSLDKFMWTCFERAMVPGDYLLGFEFYGAGKKHVPPGYVEHLYCNLKNDSFDTELVLGVNGFDEAMDGCHVHQDSEFAVRASRAGASFFMDHGTNVFMFDPHGIAIIRDMDRQESSNHSYYESRKNGSTSPANSWSLREKRAEVIE